MDDGAGGSDADGRGKLAEYCDRECLLKTARNGHWHSYQNEDTG